MTWVGENIFSGVAEAEIGLQWEEEREESKWSSDVNCVT
jgi:hypothetical protein